MKHIGWGGRELDVGVAQIMEAGLNFWQRFICMTNI